jgi:hypothetical protein
MSDEVGPVAYRQSEEHPFLGKEIHESREFSEETAHVIDEEISRIMRLAQDSAVNLLIERNQELDLITNELLENETLSRADLVRLLGEPASVEGEDDEELEELADTAAGGADGQDSDDGQGEALSQAETDGARSVTETTEDGGHTASPWETEDDGGLTSDGQADSESDS